MQLPGAGQDTELTCASTPALTFSSAVTCCTGPQVPLFSPLVNGCASPFASLTQPPTAQLPGDPGTQDTAMGSPRRPFTPNAVGRPQTPCASMSKNGCGAESMACPIMTQSAASLHETASRVEELPGRTSAACPQAPPCSTAKKPCEE
ncbi:hypothetical protein EAS64_17235 [Trebonia kvetii]|uniref:Uncharacterized protein n=1 Tax=Trebonia kvetii TaxID=2480626 RepID=A0A6P2C1E0_9ACTN|nr:hypothetical protein EAS64_17235 [Trebonia kvetii]